MKKILLVTLLSIVLTPVTNAQTDKSKFCPDYKKIKITLTKPWRYLLSADNADGKYFVSDEQQYDGNNGPAPPVSFAFSDYEPATKTLSCVYYAYHRYNIHPTLINVGDY